MLMRMIRRRQTLMAMTAILAAIVGARPALGAFSGPFAVRPDAIFTREDAAAIFDPLENDIGPPVVSTVTIAITPQKGTATVDPASGHITYTPAKGANGQDTFHYRVCDQSLAICSLAQVSVTIRPWGDYRVTYNRYSSSTGAPVDFSSNNIEGSAELRLNGSGEHCEISPNGRQIACGLMVFDADDPSNFIRPTIPGFIRLGVIRGLSWAPGGAKVVLYSSNSNTGGTLFTYDVPTIPFTGRINPFGHSELEELTFMQGPGPVPFQCHNPFWGRSGIVCDNFQEIPSSPDPPGIYRVAPGFRPALVFAANYVSQPSESSRGRIAYRQVVDQFTTALGIYDSGPAGTHVLYVGFGQFIQSIEHPRWSPDDRKIAFIDTAASSHIVTVNADGSNPLRSWPEAIRATVPPGGSFDRLASLAWDPIPAPPPPLPGRVGGQVLFSRPFDPNEPSYGPSGGRSQLHRASSNGGGETDQLAGPSTYQFQVSGINIWGCKDARWSPDGTRIAYLPETASQAATGQPVAPIVLMNADGSGKTLLIPFPLISNPPQIRNVEWSPDGARLALAATPSDATLRIKLWSMNVNGTGLTLLADLGQSGGLNVNVGVPSWSPDGAWIAFNGGQDNTLKSRYLIPAAGGVPPYILTDATASSYFDDRLAWSPDGSQVAFARQSVTWPQERQIHVADFVATPAPHLENPRMLTKRWGVEGFPVWSPDGQAIAYVKSPRDETFFNLAERFNVWVANIDGTLELPIASFLGPNQYYQSRLALTGWTRQCSAGSAEICDGVDNDCDGIVDGDAPAPSGVPVVTMTPQGVTTLLSWTAVANATAYDVVRVDLGILRSTGGDYTQATTGCSADDYTGTLLAVNDILPAGSALMYLVRGVNCAGHGSYDSGAPGQASPRDASINAAAASCP